jgi:hypothetical protein
MRNADFFRFEGFGCSDIWEPVFTSSRRDAFWPAPKDRGGNQNAPGRRRS